MTTADGELVILSGLFLRGMVCRSPTRCRGVPGIIRTVVAAAVQKLSGSETSSFCFCGCQC